MRFGASKRVWGSQITKCISGQAKCIWGQSSTRNAYRDDHTHSRNANRHLVMSQMDFHSAPARLDAFGRKEMHFAM